MYAAIVFLLVFGFYFNNQALGMEPDHDTNKLSANPPRTKAAASERYDVITPQMFGAAGDGLTDDTDAFLKLTDYCNSNPGAYVSIPTGHYIISQQLTFAENVTIRGYGPDSLLDFSQITDNIGGALQITGDYREIGQLETVHKAGQNMLNCQYTEQLSKGDLIAVIDPEDFSFFF